MKLWFASDLNLPHVWTIVGALADPYRRSAEDSLFVHLAGKALYTWREAAIGFALGTLLGVALAVAFVHSSLLERAFVPYVVASQTIPIVALAPMIVFFVGSSVEAVVIIATYLTFFPVTIAMIRGLRAPDPRALELMRSYAASRRAVLWKVRLPASLPYLFTALKITATASIVGAIVGEGPGGVHARAGLDDHRVQPDLHHRAGEAVGRHLRHRHPRHRLLRPGAAARAPRAAQPAGGDGRLRWHR